MSNDPGGSFQRLGDHLAAQAGAGQARVTMTFAELETTILGCPLPAAARDVREALRWWSPDAGHPHAWLGWLRVGWHVTALDLVEGAVAFSRGRGDHAQHG